MDSIRNDDTVYPGCCLAKNIIIFLVLLFLFLFEDLETLI